MSPTPVQLPGHMNAPGESSEARRARSKVAVRLAPGRPVPGTRFELVRWLGDGGMGVVYEGRHLDLGKRVALKIMRPEVSLDPEVLAQFRREARMASQLGSDYIVEVFDFAELSDGRLLFVMELVEGTALVDALRDGPMDPSRLLGILRQACKGLAAAHAQGIVHRDIKPENVMLQTRRGRPDAVKILDFGISAVLADKDGFVCTTQVMGTPYYLAPEIIDRGRFDVRADVYALGCTAYEMLVGHPPFVSNDMIEVLRAHMMREPDTISAARGDQLVPSALERVIMRCLAKDPQARPRDMADLEAALCEAQIEADLRTPWDDLPLPDVDPERRERLLREMPDAITEVRRLVEPRARRRGLPALGVAIVLGVGILIGTSVAAVGHGSDVPREDPQATELERLTEAAWGAAGKSLYVYPPADEPDQPTAYSIVHQIEAMRGPIAPLAHDRAASLRTEMARTLVRLGDEFWDKEGGLAFAIDYYAQAVLFDPEQEQARERASLSPGQLALLRHKAELQEFTPGELVAVEPLVVLATDDARQRDDKLASLRREATQEGARLAEQAGLAGAAGRRDEAVSLYRRALAKDRRNLTALAGLSELLVQRKEHAKAAALLERAVGLAPKDAAQRARLGDAYAALGRYRDALDQYERAVELGDASARYLVERTRSRLQQPDAATTPTVAAR